MTDLRDRITKAFQKRVGNPLTRRLPTQTLLETTGRKSGQPRRTPLGGSRVGDQFWFVSEFGEKSQYSSRTSRRAPTSECGWADVGTTARPISCPMTTRANGRAHCRSSTVSPSAPWAPTLE